MLSLKEFQDYQLDKVRVDKLTGGYVPAVGTEIEYTTWAPDYSSATSDFTQD